MLKSCRYCGRIHDSKFDCGKKPKPKEHKRKEQERIRYTNKMKVKSREIKEKAHFLCEYCLTQGRLTYKNLETHHIEKLVDRPDLALVNENLICLCDLCHEEAEKGAISPEILIKIAQKREKQLPPVI